MEVHINQLLPKRLFLMTVANNLAKPWNLWFKRGFDQVVGVILTLLALPVMGLIAWLIRKDSPGPIFYIHERLGQDRSTFHCYKFRTMHADGEARLQRSLMANTEARQEWEVYRKLMTGKNELPFIERVKMEAWYVRNWSLWLDLIILVRTLKTIRDGEGKQGEIA